MKKIAFLLSMSLFSSVACASEATDALAAFHAALTSGDKARVAELLAADVTIYESGYVERSRAEYAGHHLPEDIAFAKTASRKVLQTSERMEGKLAMIWQETETTAKHKGKNIHIFGTETSLLEKQDGQWRIVHVHWSSRKSK